MHWFKLHKKPKFEIILNNFYTDLSKINECWNWEKDLLDGYGRVKYKSKMHLAHRLSYRLLIGDIPTGLFVCHHCDNRKCFNPNHLFIGTNDDNMKDMIKKGRHKAWAKGKIGVNAKLKIDDVIKIKKMILDGMGNTEISKIFNVGHVAISDIRNNRTWKNYTGIKND